MSKVQRGEEQTVKIENCKMKTENFRADITRVGTHLRTDGLDTKSIYIFQFSIFNFQSLSLLLPLCTLLFALSASGQAQTVSDKAVASVTNGAQTIPDLITYSDLEWQLALEPSRAGGARPASPELNQALKTLEDQLLILQEARKLPLAETNEAQKEFEDTVKKRRDELAQAFGSRAHLEERMSRVGLTSEQLDTILRDRVTIERYLAFRFRAFALVSAKEISDRYENEYGRLRNTGKIVPTLDQARDRIEHDLTEEKIAEEIDKFIDNLRDQPGTEIVILNPV
ncbi:MAG TPA: hypothetical protein DC054_26790 [Blastocatellia bacterium]|nr:hypothetical protein [Blastocatellia bacterium]